MNTPDVTKAQLLAMIAALLNLLVSFGIPLTSEQVDAIKTFMDTMLVIVGADAVIRIARNISKK